MNVQGKSLPVVEKKVAATVAHVATNVAELVKKPVTAIKAIAPKNAGKILDKKA